MSNPTGFNFDNVRCNNMLKKEGLEEPTPFLTGTSLVGIIYGDGIIIGADERETNGKVVVSTHSRKIYRLHDNIYCAASGISADVDSVVYLLQSQLRLHYLERERLVPVVCANTFARQTLFRYNGKMLCNLIIAGVWKNEMDLYCTRFEGYSERVPYASLGTGSVGAMAVLESRWHRNLCEGEARQLVLDAVNAGIEGDPLSGNSTDLLIVRRNGSVEKVTIPSIRDNGKDASKVRPARRLQELDMPFTEKVTYKSNAMQCPQENANQHEEKPEEVPEINVPKRSGDPPANGPPPKKSR
ncbi:proteasome subunit beta type-7-like [Scaptodrosophila lebanonensis]|uniref:Proteasome subunit beta n=1 Tax=Drosophila lebanonensis TaxID=7225 RepID=A0A6J2TCX6_DROLE|nr:proteasome subunit beta type-7-like [Scaptodrosophila lebanonensis]